VGNRGSKSVISGKADTTVKEQRVYGSWPGNILPSLRYTLTGFARNYQIKTLSNQIRLPLIREFSSISPTSSIKNPAIEVRSCAFHP